MNSRIQGLKEEFSGIRIRDPTKDLLTVIVDFYGRCQSDIGFTNGRGSLSATIV